MSTVDRESENKLGIAKRSAASRRSFNWPDDPQESAPPIDPNVKWIRREHLLSWALFWFVAWLGTTISGALFGGMLGLTGLTEDPTIPLFFLLYGATWAGVTGLFIFVHLAVICWMFFWLRRPLAIAGTAGFLTGAICGLIIYSPATAPLGALGAYLAGKMFLTSTRGANFLTTIEAVQLQSQRPLRFTMMDMLLRVTVLAVFLAGWTAWLQSIQR